MKVFINGKEENIDKDITIAQLLKGRNIREEVVVIELNDKIIARRDYSNTIIKEGDKIEMVFYMGGGTKSKKQDKNLQKIDLRGVSCPLNFVKTKLKLEEMKNGEILEVILDDGEPIRNVPRSVKDEGHQIIKVEKIENCYKLLIKKQGCDEKNKIYQRAD